ncbi:MAG: amidohydrolase family protein [Mycobacteriales bacterium]
MTKSTGTVAATLAATPASTARIDAHHHIWDLTAVELDWMTEDMSALHRNFGMDDMQRASAETGIQGSVLVQLVADGAETESLLTVAQEVSAVLGVVGWVDLTRPDISEELARLAEVPGGGWLCGVRHPVQDEPDPDWLRRPDVLRGLRALGKANLAFDLLTLPHQLAAATAAARDAPETTFVLDHLSKPRIPEDHGGPWAEAVTALAECPNVSGKIAGLATQADWDRWSIEQIRPYVDIAFSAFGPDRLMFGSDWPVCLLATSYAGWVAAVEGLTGGFTESESDSLWRGTATRAYRLLSRHD